MTVDPEAYIASYEEAREEREEDKMEKVLLDFVEATEKSSKQSGLGVAAWPYMVLARLYRRQSRIEKEVEILERFAQQTHAPGQLPSKLLDRLSEVQDQLKG
jgi:hypothetical protein